ncbi:alpha/beta-hydrolase [Penicillium odoratum]|uniref:alpha/beta-hydrolase n=1 Tax=Penicillium odoratum TaxID=1167516 RepID=UPI0025493116|nr:alpha/beta-hydrolase [Penicillium odoratum]KAJ5772592.1 alpha/beta-hydrolase [Penicillium odoratum]
MYDPEAQKKAVLSFRKAFKSAPWLPISQIQKQSFHERPLKGPIIVSKIEIPRPNDEEEECIRSKLWDLYTATSEGIEKLDAPTPCCSYMGEWIGIRKDADTTTPQLNMSEKEKFRGIEQNAANDTVIFFLFGGAFFRAGPPSARPLMKHLSQTSGSRVFTFQPRLSPQYTIPTILLDVIVAFFYLISPPAGALHKPIDPKKIILASDSGGALLHLHLLQFLQSLIRSAKNDIPSFRFNDRDIYAQMPRGCAFVSPGADMALSLPSVKKFESSEWMSEGAPWLNPKYPTDSIWPANPPRGDLHCDNSALCHPLIDPSTWTDWSGMPPMWIACGEETYTDGINFLVQNIRASNVQVTFVQYEFMPHVWNVVMPALPQSRHSMKLWGQACKDLALGKQQDSSAHYVKLGDLEMISMDFKGLLDIPREEVLRRMRAARDELAKFVWTGSDVNSKL